MNLSIAQVESFMTDALVEAKEARWNDEVPVGCVVVSPEGTVIARASNWKEKSDDVTGHAEIRALKSAAKFTGDWRLPGCVMICTLEPCLMCANAILQSRISELYFGAYDRKGGALSLGYDFHKDRRLNHNYSIFGGIRNYECSKLLSDFFRERRKPYKS